MAGRIEIPFQPRVVQSSIFSIMTGYMFFVAVCHRRMGKTLIAVIWLIKEAFEGKPDFRGYYFAPNQKQAKNLVWGYFKKYLAPFQKYGMVAFNETELRIDLPDGKKIFLAGAENIESYRGVYIDRAVLDEVASWSNAKYAFYEVLYPAMLDRMGRALIIGTVKGLDLFHTFYTMGQQSSQQITDTVKEWGSILMPVDETGVFTEQEISRMQTTMPEDAFQREMMCDFFADSPGILISASETRPAVMRPINKESLDAFAEVWGYDVGFSSDPSVLARRRGAMLYPLKEYRGKDSVTQARIIHREYQQAIVKPAAIYVDAGQGEGVISQLNHLGHEDIVHPIFFNSTSPNPACVNMRAFMYNAIKKWLPVGCMPEDKELERQIVNQLIDDDPDRRIKLKPKKYIKEVLGCSPDRSDALGLTFAGDDEEELTALEQAASLLRSSSGEKPSQEEIQLLLRMLESEETGTESSYDPLDFMNKEWSMPGLDT